MPTPFSRFVPRLRASWWKARRAAQREVYAFWRRRAVKPHVVMYESFAGNGMLCNPEAIFRGLRADADFAHLRHVWVLSNAGENPATVREFAGDRSVRFVRPATAGYYRALATSGYLINNATFPAQFSKRPKQVYLNTWHGTPLKRMGFDIGDAATRVGNVIRNFLSADYLLAANHFMVEQMYGHAHRLDGIYRGRVIEEGYPRIDHQFADEAEVAGLRARLQEGGIALGDRKVILYAPTWKGSSFSTPNDDATELMHRVLELESRLDSDRFVVLLKTHQVVHKYAANRPEFAGRLIPNEIPTNSVLALSEMLVTDYSSTFFDFLATGRPIAFLTPDIDDYAGYRGLYMEPDAWPGPVVKTVEQLAEALTSLASVGPSPDIRRRYEEARTRYVHREDGNATGRVIDIVFRGNHDGYEVGPIGAEPRQSLLLNIGSTRPNAITTAALALLDGIDHDRFDVSVVFPSTRNRHALEQQAQIHPAVRQFARVGTMNGSLASHLVRRLAWFRGTERQRLGRHQEGLWRDEWTRCFGLSTFDVAIDFSGYGRLWANLILRAPDARRYIWLHDDLAADRERSSRDSRSRFRSLSAIFATYRDYDALVSLSPALTEINERSLARYAAGVPFTTARSLVCRERVERNASVAVGDAYRDATTGILPPWAGALEARAFDSTFISVGPVDHAHDVEGVIRSFAALDSSRSQLLVVGGGILLPEVQRLVGELGLGDRVLFAGPQANPYAAMAASDCVVLSATADWLTGTALDAAILGLPAVPADGMRDFLDGRVRAAAFDDRGHNERALADFSSATGIRS